MANTKTIKKKVAPPQEKKVLLTEQETWDVLRFASELYGGQMGYNPMLVNARMQDMTMNIKNGTSVQIDAALAEPKLNEAFLTGQSEFFELTSMLYKRILYYLSGIPAFDFTYTCTNATDKDYKSPAYKKDLEAVKEFFDKFNPKQEFRTILKQMVRQETFFGFFRDDGERYLFQEIPENYSMITGRWENGLLWDLNMYLFLQPGFVLDMFPDIFKKLWKKAFGNKQPKEIYDPATGVDKRDSSWIYWVQTSPKDGFWCFKLQPELATRIPFLAPMFPDVVLQKTMRELQTNTYIAAASKIISGRVPMLNKDTKAAVRDSVAISPELLGKFLALMKSGLSDAIKVTSSPLEDQAAIEFSGADSDFYQNYLKTTTSSSGVNSRLIYTLDKNNAVESQLSINVDEFLMFGLYPQFENFLDYQTNKLTKKFKFKFKFEGSEFYTNRKERFDTQMSLIPLGIVMPQKIAAAIGMSPFAFIRQIEESKAMGFTDMLTPIETAMGGLAGAGGKTKGSNPSGKEGAPKKDASELSEGGENTRDAAGNAGRGGDE
ncbi:MAG: hypothetical protein WA061_02265 [Microgenomates group bacterium]